VTCDKEIDDKRELIYYKDVTNPNLKNQKYISIIARLRDLTTYLSKIRMNL